LLQILSHHEASLIFACYAAFLALGHTLWCKTVKSATIPNYLAPYHRQPLPGHSSLTTWHEQQQV
jgi:hypothetical protein